MNNKEKESTVKMPALNGQFGEMAAEVFVRIFARPIAGSENPNCSMVDSPLRQAAAPLQAMR